MRFRGWLYSLGMKHCGYDFQVTHDARLITLQEISVGRNCFIGNNSLVFASINGEISLADEVQIGPHCVIISDNHTIKDGSFRLVKQIMELSELDLVHGLVRTPQY